MSSVDNFRSSYEECLSNRKQSGESVLFSHFGELEDEQVNTISVDVETKMLDLGVKKGLVKRMFNILVEALQNIRLHGERDETNYQRTYLIITQSPNGFHIITANIILNDNIPKIKNRIDTLNSMEEADVKEYYMKTLTNGEISQKGGAGLGFITISMKSKNKMNYRFVSLNDSHSIFEMEALLTPKGE